MSECVYGAARRQRCGGLTNELGLSVSLARDGQTMRTSGSIVVCAVENGLDCEHDKVLGITRQLSCTPLSRHVGMLLGQSN